MIAGSVGEPVDPVYREPLRVAEVSAYGLLKVGDAGRLYLMDVRMPAWTGSRPRPPSLLVARPPGTRPRHQCNGEYLFAAPLTAWTSCPSHRRP